MRKQALLSVSDKTGVVEGARDLSALGYERGSTRGAATQVARAGVADQEVAE